MMKLAHGEGTKIGMGVESKTDEGHGGRRDGAGRRPFTIEGILKKMSPAEAGKFRSEMQRYALRLLIDRARGELRQVE
jgi:hypothetical protein